MTEILAVTFPFFALVLAGYLATRWRWLPIESIAGLNTFVLYFALPCLLYRFGSSTPIAQLLDVPLFLMYLFCATLMVGFVVLVSRNQRIGWNDASFGALVAAFPNTGFMGVPLLVALLGSASAGPAIVSIVVDLLFTSSVCIALSRLDGADEHGAGKAGRQALKGVMVNPMPWSIVLGAISSAQQLKWPAPVDKTLSLLADAASPVALFTIGAVLARSALRAQPLLVLLVGTTAMRWGVSIDPFALMVVTLVAALPSASNVAVLSERFGADTGRIARIILLSTAAAFLTFSGFVALLRD
jgi:predicted permease